MAGLQLFDGPKELLCGNSLWDGFFIAYRRVDTSTLERNHGASIIVGSMIADGFWEKEDIGLLGRTFSTVGFLWEQNGGWTALVPVYIFIYPYLRII